MGGSGPICLPTSSHLGQSGEEVAGLPMQENHSDCSGVAQHGLVLGSSGHVQPNPTEPAQPAKPTHSAIQSDSSQESFKPKSACMAPRTSAIKEQGLPEAVAARMEAPQRVLTRSVYGYRSAIADKLRNSPINVNKDENPTRLLDSFHRDRPKGRRGIPSWQTQK